MKMILKIIGKIILTVLLLVVLVLVSSLLLTIFTGPIHNKQWVMNIAMIAAPLLMYAMFERRQRWKIGLIQSHAVSNTLIGMLIGIGMMTLSFVGIWLLGGVQIDSFDLGIDVWQVIGASFLIFVLVAISEELLCRGYMQGLIKHHFGLRAAIWTPSLIFALLHLGNPGIVDTPFPLLNILLVGLFLGLAREITGGLWLPIGFHLTWNFVQGNVFGMAVSGTGGGSLMTVEVTGYTMISGGSFGAEGSLLTTIILLLACVFMLRVKRRSPLIVG